MNTVTIYIRLLDEGSEAARPTKAEAIRRGLSRVPTSPVCAGDALERALQLRSVHGG